MNVFGSQSEESDNPRVLPGPLIKVYINPYRAFGLDESTAEIKVVRECFRKNCLSYMPCFTGLGQPKMTLKQINFAYHLVRGTIKGPAQKIKETIDVNPYLQFEAMDILPLLRPMRSSVECPKEYRGFRQLTVTCSSHFTSFSYVKFPPAQTTFVFDVHYCMRRHSVQVLELYHFPTIQFSRKSRFCFVDKYDYFAVLDLHEVNKVFDF